MTQIPRVIADSIVAIGSQSPENNSEWSPDATGFLYGHSIRRSEEGVGHDVYLVTARHVFDRARHCFVAINGLARSPARAWRLELADDREGAVWTGLEKEDLALVRISVNQFEEAGAQYSVLDDVSHCTREKPTGNAGDLFEEGNRVFVIGYPFQLVQPPSRQYPVVRRGTIARSRNFQEQETILIDCEVFKGNSGGLVMHFPQPFTRNGPNENAELRVMGVVSRTYMTVTNGVYESSDICAVLPLWHLDSLIDEHIQRFGPVKPATVT
ncbi:MAG: trypsin-like peptidase domain-containing protein [Candidatus Melainabacteria bacterium]|nr:trypsin-like peptidase domain-containing protein [Candidatus Melainabacteria bacterium]